MVVGLILGLGLAAPSAYDPAIDQALRPRAGLSVSAGVQRLQDEFGVWAGLASPQFAGDHLAVRLEGGVGWYPDIRALPEDPADQDFGAWSLYGHARLLLQASTRIALASGRLYAAAGPSLMILDDQLTSDQLSPGIYGVLGLELFAGDDYRAFPVSVFFEAGGTAHLASADIENRVGPPQASETTIDRPIGTGLALSAGLRFYAW